MGSEQVILQLKVGLRGAKPPIWRRLQVPARVTLGGLHDILLATFGWYGFHLHVFETPLGDYGEPDPELDFGDERTVSLNRVGPVGGRLRYVYDFGDNWVHDIVVEKRIAAQVGASYPRCVAGRRAIPPEDCGGIWAYQGLLEALADPAHPEHDVQVKWLSETFGTDTIDADDCDLGEINDALTALRA